MIKHPCKPTQTEQRRERKGERERAGEEGKERERGEARERAGEEGKERERERGA